MVVYDTNLSKKENDTCAHDQCSQELASVSEEQYNFYLEIDGKLR